MQVPLHSLRSAHALIEINVWLVSWNNDQLRAQLHHHNPAQKTKGVQSTQALPGPQHNMPRWYLLYVLSLPQSSLRG